MLHEVDTSVPEGLSLRRFVWQILIVPSAFLLISMGGAIFAAPITVPLLWISLSRRNLSRVWRITAAVVLTLTVAEFVWAAGYLLIGESKPWIWLIPLTLMIATAAASTRTVRGTTSR